MGEETALPCGSAHLPERPVPVPRPADGIRTGLPTEESGEAAQTGRAHGQLSEPRGAFAPVLVLLPWTR